MQTMTIPIGPGRGQSQPLPEVLAAVTAEMRGHVRDLRDLGQGEQADLLERYLAALDLIYWQLPGTGIFGTPLPGGVIKLANKHRLAMPTE